MRIHAGDPGAKAYRVVDKATNEEIRRVVWADTDTREIGVIRLDGRGCIAEDGEGAAIIDIESRSFQVVRFTDGDESRYLIVAETNP